MPPQQESANPFKLTKPIPRQPHKHDSMCITIATFLSWCWCRCPQCWDNSGFRCTCSACTCRQYRRVA